MTKEKFNELLHKLQIGDMYALEPLYNEFHSNMVASAIFIVHNEADADDVASEALLKLIAYAKRKKPDDHVLNPGGFMYVITRTTALDYLRKKRDSLNVEDTEVCATEDLSKQVIDKYDLIRAMSDLTDEERELAIRHFLFGEKIKEINKDLDIHYDSIRRKLREIRRKINGKL
ncbi:MAG: sigma-70 family RNA polymerase sigma factor [Roseburia sp.]|nr:sigma-70 family RNA polymerase sigma factor [Roseburia sp.]